MMGAMPTYFAPSLPYFTIIASTEDMTTTTATDGNHVRYSISRFAWPVPEEQTTLLYFVPASPNIL